MRRLIAPATVLAVALLSIPRTALPCGPGVHVLEAGRALDRLAAADPAWAQVAATPGVRSWLAMGAISPDFQWWADALTFGHDFGLSYRLLDRAEADGKGALYRAFALGHMSHVTASDPACEQFYAPTLTAAAPLGIVDLNAEEDGLKGESETLFEALGDFILGDFDTVVDVLYDFRLDGAEADARGQEVFRWYCEEGAAHAGKATDCDLAWQQFGGLLGYADSLLGNMSREESKEFVHSLIDQPIPDLVGMFLSGFVYDLVGSQFAESANFAREKDRLLRSPLADRAFWDLYEDGLSGLGPAWAVDRLALRNTGFPSWIDKPFACGNIQSSMQTLPGEFAVVPGLIVDGLEWRRDGGGATAAVARADQGAPFTLWVRLFSAHPRTADVRVVVKKDLPGNDTGSDPVVAEQSFPVDVDPAAYVRVPRTELALPFALDLEGALGLYAEFYLDDGLLPWFTTNWDRIWLTGAFDFEQPATWAAFGTYGRWPASLRVKDPDVQDPWLFVKARVAPAGGGVDGAFVAVDAGGDAMPRTAVTGWNGIGVFPQAGNGPLQVTAEAVGFAPSDPVEASPTGHQETWATVWLHALPAVAVPGPWQADRRCAAFTVAAEPFQGQVDRFLATGETLQEPAVSTAPVEAVPGQAGQACFDADQADGTTLRVRAVARYKDGTTGYAGTSGTVGIDGSAPGVGAPAVEPGEEPSCAAGAPTPRPFQVSFPAEEPHSPVVAYGWRLDDGAWQPLADPATFPGELPGTWLVRFPGPDGSAPGRRLSVRADNAAGLSGEASVTLPEAVQVPACPPEPDPEPEPDPGPGPDLPAGSDDRPDAAGGDEGAPDLPPADLPGADTAPGKKGGGCAAGGTPASGLAPLLLALAAWGARRRRP